MTLISSEYKGHYLVRGPHLETIYPALTRKVEPLPFEKIDIDTPDNDFLELDIYKNNSNKWAIISHGLEGNSRRAYMLGATRALHESGFNVICWNFRGCGDKINRQARYYHSGATEDLLSVVEYTRSNYRIDSLVLVGFSLGGNLTLKFLGEQGSSIPEVKAAAVVSTPLDLDAGSDQLMRTENILYTYRFLRTLKKKAIIKHEQHPGCVDLNGLSKVKNLRDFDDQFTAPLHGFVDAKDYYTSCSSKHFVGDIQVPTLILNALNDPFLPEESYPFDLLKPLQNIFFETPERGGHVGFYGPDKEGIHWSDRRIEAFLSDCLT